MKEVAEPEDPPTVVDGDQGRRFVKEASGSDSEKDGCTMKPRGSLVSSNKKSMNNKKKIKKVKKRKKYSSSSDSESDFCLTPRPRRSCALRGNGYSAGPLGGVMKPPGTVLRRPIGMSTSMCRSDGVSRRESGPKLPQKTWASGSARPRVGIFSGCEDDINMTVKKIKLQSAKRKSVEPETATLVKKIKPDLDAAERADEKAARSPRNCVPRRRKLVLSYHSSDESDFEKEDKDMMSASPFSGISHEGKPSDGLCSNMIATNGDKLSAPLRKFSASMGASGKQQPSRLLDHGLEKLPLKENDLKPNGINLVSRDNGKTLASHGKTSASHGKTSASQHSIREGAVPCEKPSPSRASHDSCSKPSVPKKRGRPKMNRDKEASRVTTMERPKMSEDKEAARVTTAERPKTSKDKEAARVTTAERSKTSKDKEAARVTATERSRECSTSKPAPPTKVKSKIATEKQKLRNKVKDLLLSSGWTIELHPRKGRDYMDSVYVSPEGTGYWSITKAYAVYQQKMVKVEKTDDTGDADAGKVNEGNGTDTNQSAPEEPLVSGLPTFDLSILKRHVVNKRRSKDELALIRANHKVKKKGRKGVTKKSTSKRDGFIVPRNCHSHSAFDDHLTPGRKRKNKRALVRESSHDSTSDTDNYIPYAGKRTVLGWLIDSGVVSIDATVKYMGKTQKDMPLEGRIKQDGIQCSCCDQVFTVSSFEIHAGSDLCRPFQNIFVEELGLSLLDCQEKAWHNQEESVRRGYYSVDINDDPNDDTCGICGDGGELICCDSCPSTYHLGCLGMEMLPPGDWHCSYCACIYCGAADCSTSEEDGDNLHLLVCDLCERKYHQSCFPVDDAAVVDSNDIDSLFCGQSCSLIFLRLQKLLGITNNLEDGFSWSLIQRVDDSIILEPPLKANCNAKIAVALAVMDECFLPILDHRSGVNLIQNVVYNFRSNFNRLNYSGFYTFILERDDEIVAAASVRIHGRRLAEMPFIGTRSVYRRQGMCRRLLTVIEKTLSSLGVERLLIPAISELEETWTNVFNFRPLDEFFNQEVKSINLMVFPGTGLLDKQILEHAKAEASCRASKIAATEIVIDDARHMSNRSLVSQNPENGVSMSPEVNECLATDTKSSKSSATVCDAADVSNNTIEIIVQKDSIEMAERDHTHFDLAVFSNPATDKIEGCFAVNCSGPEAFDSCNLPENQD